MIFCCLDGQELDWVAQKPRIGAFPSRHHGLPPVPHGISCRDPQPDIIPRV